MAALGSFVLVSLLACCLAADIVQQCPDKNFEDLNKNVQLTPCKKSPCKLRKGTSQNITIAFTPDKDIADIKNQVSAEVLGLPVPFIGVDGTSICDKIYNENHEKVECPVKKGTKYIYKDSFPVLDFYPSIYVRVHWALMEGKNDIICFEVPAKIS